MCIDPSNLQTVAACEIPEQYSQMVRGVPGVGLDVSPDWLAVGVEGHAFALATWRQGMARARCALGQLPGRA